MAQAQKEPPHESPLSQMVPQKIPPAHQQPHHQPIYVYQVRVPASGATYEIALPFALDSRDLNAGLERIVREQKLWTTRVNPETHATERVPIDMNVRMLDPRGGPTAATMEFNRQNPADRLNIFEIDLQLTDDFGARRFGVKPIWPPP